MNAQNTPEGFVSVDPAVSSAWFPLPVRLSPAVWALCNGQGRCPSDVVAELKALLIDAMSVRHVWRPKGGAAFSHCFIPGDVFAYDAEDSELLLWRDNDAGVDYFTITLDRHDCARRGCDCG